MNHITLQTIRREDRRATREIIVNGTRTKSYAVIDLTGKYEHWVVVNENHAGIDTTELKQFQTLPDLCDYLRERFDPELPF